MSVNEQSLVERLGGRDGIQAAVVDLYARILDDHDIASYFDDVDFVSLRNHMIDFLVAAVSGAAAGYAGRPLAVAHQGLGITATAFEHVVRHLADTLQAAGVVSADVDTVLARVTPLRPLIVSAGSGPRPPSSAR